MELPIQQLQFGEDFNFFISSNIWIKFYIFWKAFYHSMPNLSLVATHPCTPQNHNSHSQTTSFEQKFGFLIGAWSVVWNFWILCESIVLYQNTKECICLFKICNKQYLSPKTTFNIRLIWIPRFHLVYIWWYPFVVVHTFH